MLDGVLQMCIDFGKIGYDGVVLLKGEIYCYIFIVYVLDIECIDVDEGVSGVMVGFNVYFYFLVSVLIIVMFS